jgi:hypothetical protein
MQVAQNNTAGLPSPESRKTNTIKLNQQRRAAATGVALLL